VSNAATDARSARLDEAEARVDGYGRDYCRVLAELTDDWVIDVFDAAVREHQPTGRVALLAIGGYGRGELAPGSDLDLLLVHDVKPKKVAKEIEPTASALWYPLWDAGVKLGHAVRRIDEQLDLARTDLDSATALITARPLAGDDELAPQVVERGADAVADANATGSSPSCATGCGCGRSRPATSPTPRARSEGRPRWAARRAVAVVGARGRPRPARRGPHRPRSLLRRAVAGPGGPAPATGRPGDVLRLEDQDAAAAAGEAGATPTT
jgi:[protein-PII] uridylyltransferase